MNFVSKNLFVLTVLLLLAPGSLAAETMFRANAQHTGVFIAGSAQPDNVLKWSFDEKNNPVTAPATSDGVVYFGSSDHNIYALYAANGSELWRFATGGSVLSSPAVAGGIVYFGSTDRKIYALNAANGSLRWQVSTNSTWDSGIGTSSPAVSGDTVYIASFDNNLYALDAFTGSIRWKFPFIPLGNEPGSSPAVDNGTVYFGDVNKKVYAVFAANGTKKWEYTGPNTISSSPMGDPVVSNGIVYMGGPGRANLTALFASNGTVRYRITLGTANWELVSPAVSGGILYSGGADTNLYALRPETGTPIWSFPLGSLLRSSPSVSDGIVYAPTMGKILYAIYAGNGTEKWRFSPPNDRGVWGSPVIADGLVYIDGDGADHFYAVGNGTPARYFSGRVLAGETGNLSGIGLRDVPVHLYGSGENGGPGSLISSTVTDSNGYYLLPLPAVQYPYLSLIHEDSLPGSHHAGASSAGGQVINASWIRYTAPFQGTDLSGNTFWDFVPTVLGDFSASPLSGPAPLVVVFRDNSTGSPVTWNWIAEYNTTTGNGFITSLTPDSTYIYTRPGLYSVQMRIFNAVSSDWVTRIGYINVTAPPAVVPLPGQILSPSDPDHDGLFEDLNGNGRIDFNDVVLFFRTLSWISAHEPVEAFDFNGNGRIDFNDLVVLFRKV